MTKEFPIAVEHFGLGLEDFEKITIELDQERLHPLR